MTHPLLVRAKQEKTPLIEGSNAIFLWQGQEPPYLRGDFSFWASSDTFQAEKIEDGLWQYTVPLPEDAYAEYAFFGEPEGEESRLLDPLNPRTLSNGTGAYNHYFEMPAVRHTSFTRYQRGTPRGTVTHHRLAPDQLAIGKKRDLWLYQPPVADPVPLLLVYDGKDYYRHAKLNVIVDHLIAQKRMAPVALAMLDNAAPYRFAEYHTSESTLYAVTCVYQMAQLHLRLIDPTENPGTYGVMGASLGGLMALFTGLRMQPYIGKVLSQAGAFDICPAPGVEPLISQLVKHLPTIPLTIWQDVGSLDWLLESNRAMKQLLDAKGYALTYLEYTAGHNFTAWRNTLPNALMTLYPPD
jgi:enterochelin esterase-like enzyme